MRPGRRIDYDRISATYDRYRHGAGPYLDRLAQLAETRKAVHVVELGAGTGQSAQAFLERYPCALTAVDASIGMLARARKKAIAANWVQASALHLPLDSSCARFLFSVYMLHHIPDLNTAFRECARVLDSGIAAFITASHDYIDRHPMNRYFPSFTAIEKARFQPIDLVLDTLNASGFTQTEAEYFQDPPRPIDAAYVDRIASKFVSTYELIPEAEFEEGVARLRADIAPTGRLDIPMVWECTLVWGGLP